MMPSRWGSISCLSLALLSVSAVAGSAPPENAPEGPPASLEASVAGSRATGEGVGSGEGPEVRLGDWARPPGPVRSEEPPHRGMTVGSFSESGSALFGFLAWIAVCGFGVWLFRSWGLSTSASIERIAGDVTDLGGSLAEVRSNIVDNHLRSLVEACAPLSGQLSRVSERLDRMEHQQEPLAVQAMPVSSGATLRALRGELDRIRSRHPILDTAIEVTARDDALSADAREATQGAVGPYRELSDAMGRFSSSLRDIEAKGGVDDEASTWRALFGVEDSAISLARSHHRDLLLPLLDAVRTQQSPGEYERLVQCLGLAEIAPSPGELLAGDAGGQLTAVVEGAGSRSVIKEVLQTGYCDADSGEVVRKATVAVVLSD